MGWRSMRTDDVERLESITVQLEEAKRLIEQGTATHARLAFLLLDNAAEVLMFRNVECLLITARWNEQILRRYDELLELTDEPDIRQDREEVASRVVSKKKRGKLRNYFNAKADFLVEHNSLDQTQARVLKRLHSYRNELYHEDTIRIDTIQPACLLYFDLICTLLEHLTQFEITTLTKDLPPALAKYRPAEIPWGNPPTEIIAAELRANLGIDETTLQQTLTAHLTSRLSTLVARIEYIQSALFSGIRKIDPDGPWQELVIRLAQVHDDGDEPPGIAELLRLKMKYGPSDLPRWRKAVDQLSGREDRLSLFAAFADIEEDLEPFEIQLEDLAERIAYEEEMAENLQRGK